MRKDSPSLVNHLFGLARPAGGSDFLPGTGCSSEQQPSIQATFDFIFDEKQRVWSQTHSNLSS